MQPTNTWPVLRFISFNKTFLGARQSSTLIPCSMRSGLGPTSPSPAGRTAEKNTALSPSRLDRGAGEFRLGADISAERSPLAAAIHQKDELEQSVSWDEIRHHLVEGCYPAVEAVLGRGTLRDDQRYPLKHSSAGAGVLICFPPFSQGVDQRYEFVSHRGQIILDA